jgi:hypothetical protein
MEKSHLYARGRVLRHPLSMQTVGAFSSVKDALRYCRQNGYSVTLPANDVDSQRLEQRL